jgi:GT2 family glycosyltransferase
LGAATPQIAFTLAKGQSAFFVELAEALQFELEREGVLSYLSADEFPEIRSGLVHVFIAPSEFVELTGWRPPPELLGRSITISSEQPTSGSFPMSVEIARHGGAVYDTNPSTVQAYRSAGVAAEPLRIGYTAGWDRFDAAERDIDVLFIGRLSERRARALASHADILERFRCHLQISDNTRPSLTSAPDFIAGDEKRDLLARAKVLLNIHADDGAPDFEALRVVEAICAGCVVVSEHSREFAPLRWGDHLLTGGLKRLGLLCAIALEDVDMRERLRRSAYEFLVREDAMAIAATELRNAAGRIDEMATAELSAAGIRAGHLLSRRDVTRHRPRMHPRPSPYTLAEGSVHRALKSQHLALVNIRRRLDELELRFSRSDSAALDVSVDFESPACSTPHASDVTVIVPLYNHAESVIDALDSVERSAHDGAEIVVVDDASSDGGAELVREWMEARPHRAGRLVRHAFNRGLSGARNSGVRFATSDLLLMLDSDNQLRSTAIDRLKEALEQDPDASFSYGILDRFSADGPEGLVSVCGWDPERLRGGNYIDALALIRRGALEAVGGYSEDPRLALGWEDYDLWARFAEAGHHGAFVPEMIARYRVGHSSMLSITNISFTDAYAAVADHAPNLMRNLKIPH